MIRITLCVQVYTYLPLQPPDPNPTVLEERKIHGCSPNAEMDSDIIDFPSPTPFLFPSSRRGRVDVQLSSRAAELALVAGAEHVTVAPLEGCCACW